MYIFQYFWGSILKDKINAEINKNNDLFIKL